MRQHIFFGTILIGILALSGCVQTRAYLEDRERVDQDLPGMRGFAAEEQAPRKKTRKVIVLEVSEKTRAGAGTSLPGRTLVQTVPASDGEEIRTPTGTLPGFSGEALLPPASALPVQYKVEKDDTLQKIAKKFYGSYSRWTVIYDANRDVIKDPNFLKPGTVLTIRPLEVKAPAAE
ncbi:MAG: LysM peptidoglycan-binding domain-containing protein [Elusimicrobia bacterium]|nr:LysM peptidoglycan-binding domain-containing protein [Elusimicrobiota bacterium]